MGLRSSPLIVAMVYLRGSRHKSNKADAFVCVCESMLVQVRELAAGDASIGVQIESDWCVAQKLAERTRALDD